MQDDTKIRQLILISKLFTKKKNLFLFSIKICFSQNILLPCSHIDNNLKKTKWK